jgi:hypothetical protein
MRERGRYCAERTIYIDATYTAVNDESTNYVNFLESMKYRQISLLTHCIGENKDW